MRENAGKSMIVPGPLPVNNRENTGAMTQRSEIEQKTVARQ
jgi:hypothetical protein